MRFIVDIKRERKEQSDNVNTVETKDQQPENEDNIESTAHKESTDKCNEKQYRGLFWFSIVSSYISAALVFLFGIIDLVLLQMKYPVLETISILDNEALAGFVGSVSNNVFVITIAIALIVAWLGNFFYRSQNEDIYTIRRLVVIIVCLLLGAFVGFFITQAIQVICSMLTSFYSILTLIAVLIMPTILGFVTFLVQKRKNDGIAFSCFGFSVSVASIYLSGMFFVLSIMA